MAEQPGFTHIVFLNLLIGVILGIVFHRSDFCMAGMFRDMFLFKQTFMVRIIVLQVVVTMILFLIAKDLRLIQLYPPPNLSFASSGTLIGGVVFGMGMVLAGGCVIGTLYKMGAGSIPSVIAFGGLIIGSGLYAELHPLWKHITEKTVISRAILLPQLPNGRFLLPAVLFTASLLILRWVRLGMLSQRSYAEGYILHWKTAVIVSVLNLAVYISSETPLAVSTGYAKMAAYIERLLMPGHYEALSFFKKASFSVPHPAGNSMIAGGPGAQVDHIFITEVTLIAGVVLGAFISAVSLKEFKWKICNFPPPRQALSVLSGGILLALGSRMAGGCNVKFIMSGLPLLSIQALLFLAGISAGAWMGTHLLKQWIIKK
ncbi:MAG: YeeE/YedE family protein [Nitrospirae bacterium]|nr:YeeE/YedE family protein [Nitrospirota bacterium]